MKIGYPEYNDTTGEIIEPNNDIACNTKSCNLPSWRNESWEKGKVPGLNLINPPMKDTIIVPQYGYIVIRIKADNPGQDFIFIEYKDGNVISKEPNINMLFYRQNINNMGVYFIGSNTQ